MSKRTAEYGVHLTMIHQWKRSLLEGAGGIGEVPITGVDLAKNAFEVRRAAADGFTLFPWKRAGLLLINFGAGRD